MEMVNDKRSLKNNTSEEGKQEYRRLRNLTIRKSRRYKERHLCDVCEEKDIQLKSNNLEKPYGKVKQFFGQQKRKVCGIKDQREQYVYEEEKVEKKVEWIFWKSLWRRSQGRKCNSKRRWNRNRWPHTKAKFQKALNDLINKKTPRVDKIPAELLNNCGEKAEDTLFKIFSKMYETGVVPS